METSSLTSGKPYKPHKYQKHGIEFMIGRACAGLFWDPGLGKTSAALAAFRLMKRQGIVNRMLVIAPLRPAQSVWPGEKKKWSAFDDLTMNLLHGSDKLKKLREQADIDVINPEGLPWIFSQELRRTGSDPWPWDMLVVDESTRFKHVNTQRFRILKPYLQLFGRRYILTGSPAPNGLLDLYGQIFLLDLGTALGQKIFHYKTNYFTPGGYMGYEWFPKPDAPDKIYKKLKPLVSRLAAEDYLDLDPYISNTVEVALPSEAMAKYQQMETLLLTQIKDSVIVAANAAAATSKCRQIANGGIYHADGKTWSQVHEAKVEAVQEIIEELQGKPALVAYEYRHDLERLVRRFPGAPFIGGGVSSKRFREIESAWNRGDLPVLFAQPQSVAHGLNLQGTGAAVIFFGLTWNLEDYEQLIRRVWRQGQRERVVVHHIVAKGTVDEVIMKVLGRKDQTQRALLDALKTHLHARPVPTQ
jgi:SNF2 family DNA or RNA helicase